nr:M56 family metallopeptidase [Pedobacter sp. ASV19]
MEQLVIYLLKSALYTLIFLGIYWCFLKNETFYRFNRWFLLLGLLSALALPFYTYTYQVHLVSPLNISDPVSTAAGPKDTGFPLWIYVLSGTYLTGICFLVLRHLTGILKIQQIIVKHGYILSDGFKLIETPDFKASFSIFNYIIMDSKAHSSPLEKRLVLAHELAHVKQMHWVDLLLGQLFCTLQWFNPFAWTYLDRIKQNHEFLADEAVLLQGHSVAVYRATLINHTLGTQVFALASSFAQIDQLKRIKMMMKPASASFRKFAVLLVLPALAFFLWAFAKPELIISPLAVSKIAQPKVVQEKPVTTVVQKKKIAASKPKSRDKAPEESKTVKAPVFTASVPADSIVKQESVVVKMPDATPEPLVFVDGAERTSMSGLNPDDIAAIYVLKDKSAIAEYGERGRNGVVKIELKKPNRSASYSQPKANMSSL